MPDVHVHEPFGIVTTSPSVAVLIALCTSLVEQDAAVRVAP
jgi:hypothetical protein